MDPLTTERAFFAALTAADAEALAHVLAEDFVLVDVMQGSVVPREALLELVGSRQLRFESVDVLDSNVRLYGAAAVIVGRTHMQGRFDAAPFETDSRYTHVYAQLDGRWRLVSAQGTPIREG